MQASLTEFIDILSRIEQLKTNKLITNEERLAILRDIQTLIPAHENYARNYAATKKVVLRVLEEAINGGKKESPAKGKKAPSKSTEEKLLLGADENTGGAGVTEAVVNKAPKKRGATKGRTRRAS